MKINSINIMVFFGLPFLFAVNQVMGSEIISINFLQNAKSLYDKGQVSQARVHVVQNYHWLGGTFSIDFPYSVSRLNEKVSCYKLEMNEVATKDQLRIGAQELSVPVSYYCTTPVDTEVRP